MSEYRKQQQFIEILDSIYNGAWEQAAEETVAYGFYANDFENGLKEYCDNFGIDNITMVEFSINLMFVIESATKLRCNK